MADDQLTMNRIIHSAVRRDLARIESGLRDLPDGDRGRAEAIQRTWENLQAQLTRHHEGEDTHVWPWLQSVGVDPALLAAMESEHEALAAALADAARAVGLACSSAEHDQALRAADAVATARRVVDQHLAHEEAELEPVMRPHLDSPGWKAVEKELRSAYSPKQGGWFYAWLQDGATNEELAYVRSVIPGPVLAVLTRGLGRGYTKQVASAWS